MYCLRKLSLIATVVGLVIPPASAAAQGVYTNSILRSLGNQQASTTMTLTASSAADTLLTVDTIAIIDAYLDTYSRSGRFSGNVIITQGEGAVTRSYGLANQEHQVANTPTTKFRIGSVTKQFTAVAILQLQEQGLLDVQAPISTYLPDYPEGDRITIHQLLTHTAGIPEYLDPKVFPDLAEWMRLPATLEQLADRFKDLPLEFEPGEKFKYSNSGYVLLTQIIKTVSGQPYADYVQTHIFEPLEMNNTGYEAPQTVIPHLAQGYLFVGSETYLQASPFDMSIPQGAGGLYSTAEDLSRWNQWLYGEALDPAILSEAARGSLLTPAVQIEPEKSPDTFYGYGLVLDTQAGQQRIHHAGGISGFASALAYYPEEALTVVVLSNLQTAVSGEIAGQLAAIVFGKPYKVPPQPEAVEVDPAIYERYVGTYQLLPEMQVTIRVEAGELTAQATGQEAFVLYPTSETDFFAEVADITVTFSLAEDETVEGLTLRQLGQERFAPKINE